MDKKIDGEWKRIEKINRAQRMYDRLIIQQAFMRDTNVELKTLAGKRKHPFAIENIQNN